MRVDPNPIVPAVRGSILRGDTCASDSGSEKQRVSRSRLSSQPVIDGDDDDDANDPKRFVPDEENRSSMSFSFLQETPLRHEQPRRTPSARLRACALLKATFATEPHCPVLENLGMVLDSRECDFNRRLDTDTNTRLLKFARRHRH